jgi:hypothetical protein
MPCGKHVENPESPNGEVRLPCEPMRPLTFFVVLVAANYLGRKAGWALSHFLYRCSPALCVVLCSAWAVLIAYGLRLLIDALHPGIILKVISFGDGAYIANVNYGLVAEWSVPESQRPRHMFITVFPMLAFVLSSAILAFGPYW